MDWLAGMWAILVKDLRLEFRSRYAINMLLMFVMASLVMVVYSIGQEEISPRVQSALIWVVIMFSASVGLGRSFIGEEERGTVLLLQLNTRPDMVYAGKLLFNILLILLVNSLAFVAYIFLLGIEVERPMLLVTAIGLGAISLASSTTLLAALIARSSNQGALLPVLLFPLLVPLLLSVVHATQSALAGGVGLVAAQDDIKVMIGFAGVTITMSVLLFDYVWND
ncbi:MAG: heme exporter protein CcmB [Rhodothermales bacterium]